MTEKHIVWHDLMTTDVERAQRFYSQLLGWRYEVEHAADFAWGHGEADYPLIVSDGMAHGGLIESPSEGPAYWLPYFQVMDVDAVAVNARKCGATVERDSFDVPGVGRNAVIRDPQGAVFCPHTPSHSFPPPHGTFLWDQLFTPSVEQAVTFYQEVLGIIPPVTQSKDHNAHWIPMLAAGTMEGSLDDAEKAGAVLGYETDLPGVGPVELLNDPTGAPIGLVIERENQKPPLSLPTG